MTYFNGMLDEDAVKLSPRGRGQGGGAKEFTTLLFVDTHGFRFYLQGQ